MSLCLPRHTCFELNTIQSSSSDNVVEEEDGEQIHFLGGNSSSGTKKYRGSNSNDGGNTGDGVKIAGGVIGSGDEIEQELLQTMKYFHACKQEEGQSVSSCVLKMKSYIDNLERLGQPVSLRLAASLILVYLSKEYDDFVQNYIMHRWGKTVRRVQKNKKKKPYKAAKGNQRKGKVNMGYAPVPAPSYAPKPKNPLTPKKDNFAKDAIYHQCGEGLKGSRKLKPGALWYVVGDGHRATVEAIEEFHLCLPNTSLHHEEDDQEIDEPQSDINPIRKSTRTRRTLDRMCLHVDAEVHELGDLGEPANYKAALLDPESDKWLNAMNMVMQSMKDNEVWYLVDIPPNGKTVGRKWLLKKKTNMDGAVHTFKDRLVAKGFTQTYGVDYEETFSPVADIRAIRILIAIAAFYDYEI
ncbi:zinc finger, CCHC-type containing protein [Tanacetum coccineum]